MAIDWNNDNFKLFMKALENAYPNADELTIFCDLNLDLNIATITSSNDNLRTKIYKLLKWAQREEKLDRLFFEFRKENPRSDFVEELDEPFASNKRNISDEKWDELFDCFDKRDLSYIASSFLRAFECLNRSFWQEHPEHPPLINPSQIKELLKIYDEPELAVRFVEQFIEELNRSNLERNVSTLLAWRDRMATEHNVGLKVIESGDLAECQGYLLILTKQSGRVTKEGQDVVVFPELYIDSQSDPIEFNASSVTCPLVEVCSHISTWVQSAEEALLPYNCSSIIVEVFLPCVCLEEDVAQWEIRNSFDRPRLMGGESLYLIRSTDRALSKTLRTRVQQKWERLKAAYGKSPFSSYAHPQTDCPEVSHLTVALYGKMVLNLASELPTEPEQRIDIYYDIINSGVPVAIWSCDCSDSSVNERKREFQQFLEDGQLTNFADLAQRWRVKRNQANNNAAKHMSLLCDCPDRWPNFPDTDRDEDLLVAI